MPAPYDAIVIGAGHNGLAAARVLASRGRSVLVLEKNNYVGGMAGTRSVFAGCRNEVGASVLFPLAREVLEAFRFEDHGAEFIELPMMAINLAGAGQRPLMFYTSQRRQLWHLLRHHLLPELGPMLLTLIGFSAAAAVTALSALAFVGIGLRPPTPEWGSMMTELLPYYEEAPWHVLMPGLLLAASVLGLQLAAGERGR